MLSGYTLNYLMVNAGALIGTLACSFLFEFTQLLGFAVAIILALGSGASGFFAPGNQSGPPGPTQSDPQVLDDQFSSAPPKVNPNRSRNVLLIIIAAVSSLFFWGLYELQFQIMFANDFGTLLSTPDLSWIQTSLQPVILIALGIGLVFIWNLKTPPLYLNLVFAFSLIFLVITLGVLGNGFGSPVIWLLIWATLLSIGELFLAPTVDTAIASNINPKFLGIAFGSMSILSLIGFSATGFIVTQLYQSSFGSEQIYVICLGLLLPMLIGSVVLLSIRKTRENSIIR